MTNLDRLTRSSKKTKLRPEEKLTITPTLKRHAAEYTQIGLFQ